MANAGATVGLGSSFRALLTACHSLLLAAPPEQRFDIRTPEQAHAACGSSCPKVTLFGQLSHPRCAEPEKASRIANGQKLLSVNSCYIHDPSPC